MSFLHDVSIHIQDKPCHDMTIDDKIETSVFLRNVDVSLGYWDWYWGTGIRSCFAIVEIVGWAGCNFAIYLLWEHAENEAAGEQTGIQTNRHNDFIFKPCIGSYQALYHQNCDLPWTKNVTIKNKGFVIVNIHQYSQKAAARNAKTSRVFCPDRAPHRTVFPAQDISNPGTVRASQAKLLQPRFRGATGRVPGPYFG